jgi:hypothetical protein
MDDCVVLGVSGYFVTVDFKKRAFAGGYGRVHKRKGEYSGVGWRNRLLSDAEAHLRSVSARAREVCHDSH